MSEVRAVLGLALLTLAACGRSTPAELASEPRPVTVADWRARGEARLARRDWEGAVTAFQQVLLQAPEDLHVRYALGVALAHLDRVDEALTAFTWVVDHGPADREEVRLARQWLVEAGLRPGGEPAAGAPRAPGQTGAVEGRVAWADADAVRRPAQMLLDGDEPATRGRRYWARVPLDGSYRIGDVAPGRYRLLVQVGPVRLWETTVVVEPGRTARLDLTPATSLATPAALRPAGP